MAAGFVNVKARAEQRNPNALLLQRFPQRFGLLGEKKEPVWGFRLRHSQTQFSWCHSCSAVSHVRADIHLIFADISKTAHSHLNRAKFADHICVHPPERTTYIHSSCWHISTVYNFMYLYFMYFMYYNHVRIAIGVQLGTKSRSYFSVLCIHI